MTNDGPEGLVSQMKGKKPAIFLRQPYLEQEISLSDFFDEVKPANGDISVDIVDWSDAESNNGVHACA
jgi:hypothetical protein